jgi:hypothetical protein
MLNEYATNGVSRGELLNRHSHATVMFKRAMRLHGVNSNEAKHWDGLLNELEKYLHSKGIIRIDHKSFLITEDN